MDTKKGIEVLGRLPEELVQYMVRPNDQYSKTQCGLEFISKTRAHFDTTELLAVSLITIGQLTADEGYQLLLEDIQALKDFLICSLMICRKKKFEAEDVKKRFESLSEKKLAIVLKTIEDFKANPREDIFHNEQLVDVKWNVKYVLQTSQYKQVNVPVVSLQLFVADVDGEVRTEMFNMSLAEFQSFKGEIKRMTEVLKQPHIQIAHSITTIPFLTNK